MCFRFSIPFFLLFSFFCFLYLDFDHFVVMDDFLMTYHYHQNATSMLPSHSVGSNLQQSQIQRFPLQQRLDIIVSWLLFVVVVCCCSLLLFVVCCLLLFVFCCLFVVCCLLLFVVCCCCFLFLVFSCWLVGCLLLLFVCLFVRCCLLFVVVCFLLSFFSQKLFCLFVCWPFLYFYISFFVFVFFFYL